MTSRAFRSTAAMLCILLLAGMPVQAGPIVVSEVVQVLGGSQIPASLRLRNAYQNSGPISYGVNGTLIWGVTSGQQPANGTINTDTSKLGSPKGIDSLLSGTAIISGTNKLGVDVVDQADVDGTICDCGEILLSGGFPKWPLIFLAGIPLFFIHGPEDTPPPPTSTPTPPVPVPTPPVLPPTAVPEPATLLLFGTGLAAIGGGLRRRYSRLRSSGQVETTQEG